MRLPLLLFFPLASASRVRLESSRSEALAARVAAFTGRALLGRYELQELLRSDAEKPVERPFPWAEADGRFSAPERLGKGNAGETWKAFDREHETEVAVKLFLKGDEYLTGADRGEALEQERECKAVQDMLAAESDYPGGKAFLCRCLESHVADQKPEDVVFLVLEFCGTMIHRVVEEEGKKEENPDFIHTVRRWEKQMLMALRFMHGQHPPMEHGDVHVGNVVITSKSEAKLIDFGRTAVSQSGRPWEGDMPMLSIIFRHLLCTYHDGAAMRGCHRGSDGIGTRKDWLLADWPLIWRSNRSKAAPTAEHLMSMLPPEIEG